MHPLAVAATRPVALHGHGVEVAGEQDRRVRAPGEHARVPEVAGAEQRGHVPGQAGLVARLGGHVDQLQRARGQALAELGVAERGRHGRALYLHALWEPRGVAGLHWNVPWSAPATDVSPSRATAPPSRAGAPSSARTASARCRTARTSPSCKELLRTAGVATVGELVQHRDKPHPNLYLGPGKVEELKPLLKAADANLVVVDDELTPRQERNLEKEIGLPVIDRTAVILDIFADHAHSAEGKMQVELAQLEYNMARMRGLWTHLERLGAGRGVGGIGTRGPGESQIETDRRLARDRIHALRRRLDEVQAATAPCSGPSASARTCPTWRSRATRTPASRRCSTR